MKILVIGSRGFIGSHCVEYFSRRHEVWECDVVMDYNSPRYVFIEAVDSDFRDLFRCRKFDVCINCSGAASVPFSLDRPFNDFQLNAVNVFKILDAIRCHNPECRYINMSSAAVYGNPLRLPVSEDQDPSPVSPYGVHKMTAERICDEFTRFWGIKTCCIRIFSAYGPGLKKQLLWDISQKLKSDGPLMLFGTGKETRDFIHIDDLVRLIDTVIRNAAFDADVINAASGVETAISRVAETMVELISPNREIVFSNSARKGDPLNWVADISKVSAFGYSPEVDIVSGIKSYVAWLEENALL